MMVRCNAPDFDDLGQRLSTRARFLDAAEELRTLLLCSTPSLLVSGAEKLISLFEVAKGTLKESGISLHTFSSCPDSLSPYKSAYFSLLLQLQAQSHRVKLNSEDLQVRLARLLFPLSTQLRVCTKTLGAPSPVCGLKDSSIVHPPAPSTARDVPSASPLPSGDCSNARRVLVRPVASHTPLNIPPNAMLPPPAPLHHQGHSVGGVDIPETTKRYNEPGPLYHVLVESVEHTEYRRSAPRYGAELKRRRIDHSSASRYLEKSGRHPVDYASKSPHRVRLHTRAMDSDGSSSSDEDEDEDADGEPDETAADDTGTEDDGEEDTRPVIPAQSPLKRSFGIFCTGKGTGVFNARPSQYRKQGQIHLRHSSSQPQIAMDIDS